MNLLLSALIAASGLAMGASDACHLIQDPEGDAVVRRTDPGNDGALHPDSVLPDILSIRVCGWEAPDPANVPFEGWTVEGRDAELFRLDLELAGLVNPPGAVFGPERDPFVFGPSPLIAFVDIDVDHKDSGGELGAAAEGRYLANVGRFGRLPEGSFGERAARGGADIDNDFYTPPQYERSGADFALVLCGCETPELVWEDGDGDGVFDAGETWIVRGRLFERSQGYAEASGAFGGSAPGLYDPVIDVRFSHSVDTDRTTVSVVWALDMAGAAALAGEPEQPADLDVSNHTSVFEAIQDVIDGVNIGGFGGPAWVLAQRWRGRDAEDYLDPSDWELTGLVGLPYVNASDGLYAWTDTASEGERFGDCSGDGVVSAADEALIRAVVYAADGGPNDADGARDGRWTLINPGFNFSVYDLNGDMVVDRKDIALLRAPGDFNWDGVVNTQDFIAFLNAWVSRDERADFNLDGAVDTLDFVAFLNAWVQG